MANGWGGRRAGAGRKPKAEEYGTQIKAADKYTAEQLLHNAETMQRLADGGIPEIRETWELALAVLIDDIETTSEGETEKVIKVKRQLFPEAGEKELVCTKRVVTIRGPDLAAVAYQLNRIAGAPRRDEEPDTRDEEIQRFMDTVLATIAEADGETKKKIIARLRSRNPVGRVRRRAAAE